MAGNDGGVIYSGGATVPAVGGGSTTSTNHLVSILSSFKEGLSAVDAFLSSGSGKEQVKDIIKSSLSRNDPSGVLAVGVGGNIAGGISLSGNLQWVFDRQGNVAITISYGGGGGVSALAGGIVVSGSNATIHDLRGLTLNTGGGGGVGLISASGDAVLAYDRGANGKNFSGWSASVTVGPSAPVDVHAELMNTVYLMEPRNIVDTFYFDLAYKFVQTQVSLSNRFWGE